MLRNGYEMAEFLSISGPIDRHQSAYYRAFAFVETDEGDLTYFIVNQLEALHESLQELLDKLEQRAERNRKLSHAIAGFDDLNYRQRALLQHAVRHPLQSYTIEGHAAAHGVHYQTARTDLDGLERASYLESSRTGKTKRFRPTAQLSELAERGAG
jgi:Fic family protein